MTVQHPVTARPGGSGRVRRLAGVAGMSLASAAGVLAIPPATSASVAYSMVDSRGASSAGVVCGPVQAYGGVALRCVRRSGFATTCLELDLRRAVPSVGAED